VQIGGSFFHVTILTLPGWLCKTITEAKG